MTDPTPAEIIAFLNGEAPLDGLWFHDPYPATHDRRGPFWWRKYLPLLAPPDAGEVRTYREGVADKDVETRLLHTAKLLYENALGCIRLHHGHRSNESDLPGWLADCRRDIEAADAAAIRKLP